MNLRAVFSSIVIASALAVVGCNKSANADDNTGKSKPAMSSIEQSNAAVRLARRIRPYAQTFQEACAAADHGYYPMAIGLMDYLTNKAPDIAEFHAVDTAFRTAYRTQLDQAIKRNAALSRPRLSVAQLKPEDQTRVQALMKRLEQIDNLPSDQRAAPSQELLADVKKLALDQPNLTRAWLMQATLSLTLNKPLEGRVAAHNLADLRAWESTKPEVLSLLTQLLFNDWMPVSGLKSSVATDFQSLVAEQARLNTGGDQQSKAAFMTRLKAFNTAHPGQPCGWLLQYHLARQLNRPLDQTVALDHLAALRPT
jgi:hypothetical protein